MKEPRYVEGTDPLAKAVAAIQLVDNREGIELQRRWRFWWEVEEKKLAVRSKKREAA